MLINVVCIFISILYAAEYENMEIDTIVPQEFTYRVVNNENDQNRFYPMSTAKKIATNGSSFFRNLLQCRGLYDEQSHHQNNVPHAKGHGSGH